MDVLGCRAESSDGITAAALAASLAIPPRLCNRLRRGGGRRRDRAPGQAAPPPSRSGRYRRVPKRGRPGEGGRTINLISNSGVARPRATRSPSRRARQAAWLSPPMLRKADSSTFLTCRRGERPAPPTPRGWSPSCRGEPGRPCRRGSGGRCRLRQDRAFAKPPSRTAPCACPAHHVLANGTCRTARRVARRTRRVLVPAR